MEAKGAILLKKQLWLVLILAFSLKSFHALQNNSCLFDWSIFLFQISIKINFINDVGYTILVIQAYSSSP